MSEPRVLWASDPNKYKSGVYTASPMKGDNIDFKQTKFIEYTAYKALREQLRVAKDTLEKLPHVGNCMNVDKDFQSGIRQLCFKCNRLKQLG